MVMSKAAAARAEVYPNILLACIRLVFKKLGIYLLYINTFIICKYLLFVGIFYIKSNIFIFL